MADQHCSYDSAQPLTSAHLQPTPGDRPRPRALTHAVRLMYVGAALSLLGVVRAFAEKDALLDAVRESRVRDKRPLDDLDAIVNGMITVSAVLGLLATVLWLLMARTNAAGLSWARVVATVLGGLSVLSLLSSVTQPSVSTAASLLAVASVVLAVVIVVLLWSKDASAYYDAQSARRR